MNRPCQHDLGEIDQPDPWQIPGRRYLERAYSPLPAGARREGKNRTVNKELDYFAGFLKWCRREKKIDIPEIHYEIERNSRKNEDSRRAVSAVIPVSTSSAATASRPTVIRLWRIWPATSFLHSNVSRGKRRQEGLDGAIPCILEPQ
jgi:hypothetical protein